MRVLLVASVSRSTRVGHGFMSMCAGLTFRLATGHACGNSLRDSHVSGIW